MKTVKVIEITGDTYQIIKDEHDKVRVVKVMPAPFMPKQELNERRGGDTSQWTRADRKRSR